jgi:pimeloyl-ACP methyl ester carboxylesterase
LRDVDVYRRSAERAAAAAGATDGHTLLIVPQFLASLDIAPHGLPQTVLHWSLEGWMGGEPAEGPAAISSFDVIDAILARLADRALFPALKEVVVAGHSGGGQVVQRYAILGRSGAALSKAGIGLRYVVANPSSYAYFSPERPDPEGGFGLVDRAACPGFNAWKYGMENLPPYAADAAAKALETAYAARDVTYLLGTADVNPNHPALDKTCAAEAQGPYRLARGRAYFAYLSARHPGLAHRLFEVPGIGHDGDGMLASPQGKAALFGDTDPR